MKLGDEMAGRSFWREAAKERPEIPAPIMRIFLFEMKRRGLEAEVEGIVIMGKC